MPDRDPTAMQRHRPPTLDISGEVLFGPAEIEKLVDRLAVALHGQSALVRELAAAREELALRQAELESARLKAEQATETLSTFLNALGHDLRAPFVAIDAGLQMIELEPGDATMHAQSVRRTCAHGLALVDDLFELIRSDAGQWRVDLRPVALRELVADVRGVVAPRAHQKGLFIETRWATDALADLWFMSDAVRLRQALINVASNAVKFTDQGSVAIVVERVGDAALRFTIHDSGPGIPPHILGTLFEPFMQGNANGGRASDGTVGAGLGLAIARRCARLLGGDIAASNRPEGGAQFTIEVPAPTCEPFHPIAAATSVAAGRRRVLVVDDAPDAARLLSHHLKVLGCDVEVAETLGAARLALASRTFDLVITDRHLPDGSGTDLVLLEGRPPIALSSACTDVPAGIRPDAVVHKPVTFDTVRSVLAQLASRHPESR
ncbi:MAG: ATP-binding protein [Phycisphaerales bacterium]